jgi:hypothetical protein
MSVALVRRPFLCRILYAGPLLLSVFSPDSGGGVGPRPRGIVSLETLFGIMEDEKEVDRGTNG